MAVKRGHRSRIAQGAIDAPPQQATSQATDRCGVYAPPGEPLACNPCQGRQKTQGCPDTKRDPLASDVMGRCLGHQAVKLAVFHGNKRPHGRVCIVRHSLYGRDDGQHIDDDRRIRKERTPYIGAKDLGQFAIERSGADRAAQEHKAQSQDKPVPRQSHATG